MIYDIDPTPNSDQTYCENCEIIIDKLDIRETVEGGKGCTECISVCKWCGRAYFSQDMFSDSLFGLICNRCVNTDNYKKGVRVSWKEHPQIKSKIVKIEPSHFIDETIYYCENGNSYTRDEIVKI